MESAKYDELSKEVLALSKDGFDAVMNYLDNIITKDPNCVEAYLIRGRAWQDGQEEALNDFNKAISINPNESESYFFRGNWYAFVGDINRAISDFSKTIELAPNHERAYCNRGLMLLKNNEVQRSIDDFTKAIELSKENVEPYFNRGLAYANMKDLSNALNDFSTVLSLDNKNAEALFRRGVCYQELGNKEEAISDFEKALELDPDNKNGKIIRDTLKELKGSGKNNPDLIIMTIGAISGLLFGFYVDDLEFAIVPVAIGAFFGVGLRTFLCKYLAEVLSDNWYLFLKQFNAERAAGKDFFEASLGPGIITLIFTMFTLMNKALISPFVAIVDIIVTKTKKRGEKNGKV